MDNPNIAFGKRLYAEGRSLRYLRNLIAIAINKDGANALVPMSDVERGYTICKEKSDGQKSITIG